MTNIELIEKIENEIAENPFLEEISLDENQPSAIESATGSEDSEITNQIRNVDKIEPIKASLHIVESISFK